jgi:DNA polymerase I-like protein with 3'-5' exonuclease and polymerase domains
MERHADATEASLDVETYKTLPICIALSSSEHEAISIPLLNHLTTANPDGIPLHDQLYIWKLIAQYLLDLKVRKIAQNGKFDQRICENVNLKFKLYWDTMLAWHTLFLEMPKNLAFITSILTEEPYYKDEGKEYNPKKDKFDRLLIYNAKDAVVTYEIKQREEELLTKLDLTDFFFNRMMPLHDMYYEIESKGILIDLAIREELREKYKGIRKDRHKALVDTVKNVSGLLEFDVNVNSPKQVHKMVYQLLGCPLRKDTREATLQALANNAVKDVNRKEIIKLTLEERKISKTIGTYINTPVSEDKRMRTQYKITGTETGRTSTEKLEPPISVTPEGLALQTLTKHGDVGADLRKMFVAKPGYTLIEADGAQAEDRVVAVLSKDWEALRLLQKTEFIYNRHNLKDDRHTLTAMLVTGKAFDEIDKEDRQIGKRTRHAANYDVGKHQLMVTLAGENVFVSEWKAGKYLEKIHQANPNIRGVFHAEIEHALESCDRRLVTPYGRARTFFNRWGRDLFKEAYAYIPQSTISDWMKFSMVEIAKEYGSNPYLLESHDSFLAEIPDEEVDAFCKIARKHLEIPINFCACSLPRDTNLVIPAEFEVGKCWYNLEKYSVLG